jgi:hypothetical protein
MRLLVALFSIACISLSLSLSVSADEELLPVRKNGKWGYIDHTGQLIIPIRYDQHCRPSVCLFSEGLVRIDDGGKWGFADANGKMVIPPQFAFAEDFSDGAAAVNVGGIPDYTFNLVLVDGGRWGFIDRSGSFLISPRYIFDHFYGLRPIFSEGLAPIREGLTENGMRRGKIGYIDKTGQFVLPPRYDQAMGFRGDLAFVEEGKHAGLIDKTGKFVWEAPFYSFSGFSYIPPKQIRLSNEQNTLVIDASGRQLLETKRNLVSFVAEGMGIVQEGERYGYVDQLGKLVVKPRFTRAEEFNEGLAAVQVGGKPNEDGVVTGGRWGFIDKQGKFVIQPRFGEASSFMEGRAAIKQKGKWGYINKEGKITVPTIYNSVSPYHRGLAQVFIGNKQSGRLGYIDLGGHYIWKPVR